MGFKKSHRPETGIKVGSPWLLGQHYQDATKAGSMATLAITQLQWIIDVILAQQKIPRGRQEIKRQLKLNTGKEDSSEF